MSLKPIEQRAFNAILKLSKDGYPPTIMEVMQAMNYRSFRGTREAIMSLREKGFLLKWPGVRQRAIVIAPAAMKAAA